MEKYDENDREAYWGDLEDGKIVPIVCNYCKYEISDSLECEKYIQRPMSAYKDIYPTTVYKDYCPEYVKKEDNHG